MKKTHTSSREGRRAFGALLLRSALLLPGLLATAPQAQAVKAKPGPIEVTQPDGSVITVMLHGDEWHNFATTADGLLILPDSRGVYEYAVPGADGRPVLSGVAALDRAARPATQAAWLASVDQQSMLSLSETTLREARRSRSRAAAPGDWTRPRYTFSTTSFPAKGSPRSIVILVDFPGKPFSMSDPAAYFDRFLNGESFTDNGATGSCRKYFSDSSMGQFTPVFDLYGPVTMSKNSIYYAARNDAKAHEMVIEAVQALDPEVDFSVYDHNGDGVIDNIYLIYSGTGRASSGKAEDVWPHSFDFPSLGLELEADGVAVNTYGMSNEMSGRVPDGIGTYCHEFSHVLGLPDLYNTESSSDSSTPGSFTILDSGCYNNDSRTPPLYSSFERLSLEWLEPGEIYSTGDYRLSDLAASNKAYIIRSDQNPDEFFMLECRARTGWDSYLPGHGMLVWYVDFDQKVWDDNNPNDRKSHHYIDLVNADNRQDGSYASDPFPGTYGCTEFSYSSTPALRTRYFRPLNVTALTDIAEPQEGLVTFSATVTEDRTPAGVGEVAADEPALRVAGRMLHAVGGASFDVADIAGRHVGTVAPGSPLEVAAGVYIAGGRKFAVR